ncbi:calcium-binding protein, partial [Acinetobacter sp. YH12086]|uniref:calcium-binding protein n=1 Tax=Acinetobacter sp. YH12086 TaxID=2601078 RepID=UPI002795C90E
MSKIGSFVDNNLEIDKRAELGDLGATVSALNNIWSSINNNQSGNNLETTTSILLAIQDGVDLIAKSKILQNVNGIGQIGQLAGRFFRNSETLLDQLDVNSNPTGLIQKSLVIDLVSDFNAIFGIAASLLKVSPVGVVLNVISMVLTSLSNQINTVGSNETIHRDDILNYIGRSVLDAASKWTDIVAPISATVLSYLPDDMNPWSGVTIDLTGSNIDDTIIGDDGRKYNIWGHIGNDTLKGGKFNDYIDGGSDNDFLYGGTGKDVLVGGHGEDELYGGEGDDVLIVSKFEFGKSTEVNANNLDNNSNKAYGGKGSDIIFGGNGADDLYAGDEENDQNDAGTQNTIYGLGGNDHIYGGAGIDTLYGGAGEDRIYGGDGDDQIYLAHDSTTSKLALDTGNNFAEGGAGNDVIHGSDGDDIIFTAEDGNAEIDANTENSAWGYNGRDILKGGDGVDYLYGGDGTDYLHGEKGDDKLYGGKDNDRLYGGEGNDDLYAGRTKYDPLDSGNNFLYGGDGDDTIYGGAGYDVLVGGEGFDIYRAFGETLIDDRDGDGKGKIYYHDKELTGTRITHESDDLSPPPISSLNFSEKGYTLNDLNFVELVEIPNTRKEKSVSYILTGKIDFTYKELTTEGLSTRDFKDTDLGVRFIVTVTKDGEPEPPINIPPNNPPTRSDPLILDLNHDGIINTKNLNQGVNFDLDGNGFAEKTSWVASQDGFVVLDLNENGEIDNGGELFGTDTLLANGEKAVDGFEALAQYDNNKDKIIDENDDIYQSLKIWKDANGDGISQQNELFGFSDLGIKSISLKQQLINVTDENNVIHTNQASFTQEVIQDGVSITKTGLAETLLFQISTSNTIWLGDEVDIDIDILELPNLVGYGSVASLHTVMTNDSTGKLKELVEKFATTPSEDQLELTHQILLYWTNNQDISASESTYSSNGMSKQQFEILKTIWGKESEWSGWPPHDSAARELEGFYKKVLENTYSQLLIQTTKKSLIDLVIFEEERIYETAEVLNGLSKSPIQYRTFDSKPPAVSPSEVGGNKPWEHIDTIWHADFNLAINSLIDLFLKNQGLGQADIEQFMLIVRGLDPNHDILYNEFFTQLKEVAKEISDPQLQDALFKSIYSLDDNLSGTEGDDVIRSWAGNDTVKAGLGDDIVYGGADHDTLYGEQGHDVIYGDGGKDKIYGGDGSDTLIGGTGDDTLDGGVGNDIYRFSLGDGNDIISSYDSVANKLDQIVFADGIAPAEVSLKRSGNDLIIKYSAEDQVTVQSF